MTRLGTRHRVGSGFAWGAMVVPFDEPFGVVQVGELGLTQLVDRGGRSRCTSSSRLRASAVWWCQRTPTLSGLLPALPAIPGLACPQLQPIPARTRGGALSSPHGTTAPRGAQEISSIPIRRSPSSRSTVASMSATTRTMMLPTVRHVMRSSRVTAVLEHWVANHPTVSSNAAV
jgi:hypothetical protein